MASQLYPSARQLFLTAQLSWLAGDYKAILLPLSYVFDEDDVFLSDVAAGVRIATSENIGSKTAVLGVASCDSIVFGTLADPRLADKIIIFKDTGDETTSPLVVFLDETEVQGAPAELVGFEYFFTPSALQGGLFRL